MADEKKDSKAAKEPAAEKAAKPAAKKASAKKETAKKPAAKKAAAKKEPAKKADAKDAKADKKEPAKKESKKPSKRAAKKAAKEEKKAPAKRKPAVDAAPPVVRARARYVRVAPRKARLVADQVRGLHVEKALALLQFSPRGAAEEIQKLVMSAQANAEENHDLIGDEMRIATITVDEGPTLRRFRPRALGRATPINKRTSHIAVALIPDEED
jgi:ribosomal protein L22